MKQLRIMVMSIHFATVYACGAIDSKTEGKNNTVAGSELVGTWVTACGRDAPEDEQYDAGSTTFDGTNITALSESFSDSACTQKTIKYRLKGTYTAGGVADVPKDANVFDMTPSAIFLTVHSSDMLQWFNGELEGTAKICGGAWELDTEKQITNALCKGSEGLETIENPFYGIYKVDGNVLYQGKDADEGAPDDGSSAENREKTLGTRKETKQ